jgi:serine protease
MLASAGAAGAAVCGDADGDGIVTTRDGVQILRLVAANGGIANCASDGCDVDRDGALTLRDGVLALRRAAELPIEDRCGGATIAGRLLVPPASDTTATAREAEPNDGPGTATVAGGLAPGRTRRFAGALDPGDPFDAWTFVAYADSTLELALTFATDAGVDLDLLVDDRAGRSATCESTSPGREQCRVSIGAAGTRAFDVVVAPAYGSAPAAYTLTVAAVPGSTGPGVAPGAGADAPLDLEPAVYRGEAAAIVPGEIVLQMEVSPADRASVRSARARTDTLTRALAAAIDATGIPDGMSAEAVAPDGTMLVALPELAAATEGAGGTAATTAATKRARAAARARTAAVAATLATSPGVLDARPNRIVRTARVPNDPLLSQQWHYDVIGLPAAWNTTIGSPATIVAVVDTGIRSDHPDIARRLVPGFDFISSPSRANDGDGLDDDPFDPGDAPSSSLGGSFHGTHVAGTIAAATDNGRGVAGVTWRTSIMPLRVLGLGGGTIFDVAQAIRFAAGLPNASDTLPREPARIINLSLTASGDDPILRSAVDAAADAGALVVVAAGNTGRDNVLSPAVFENALSVAATDRLGAPARYSSFGAAIDVAAPGGDTRRDRDADGRPDGILSTRLPDGADYALLQGTSMAAAHVSGVAALLLGAPGGATVSAERLRDVLLASAIDRGPVGRDDRYGAGLVDAATAVRLLAGRPTPPDPELVVETGSVRIDHDQSVATVPFRNSAGGTLVLNGVTVETDDGVSWLSAAVERDAFRLAADRTALTAGEHTGRVRVASSGGTVELGVVLSVAAGPPEDLGPVTILLRDAGDRTVVAGTTAIAADGYAYRFDGVAPGRYEVVATTDRDGDGDLCDIGELCGAYPDRGAPIVVTVFGGSVATARDFAVTLVVSNADVVP